MGALIDDDDDDDDDNELKISGTVYTKNTVVRIRQIPSVTSY